MKDEKDMQTFEDACMDRYDYLGRSASGTDCTGLIPTKPEDEAALESYEDLYPFAPPVLKVKKNTKA